MDGSAPFDWRHVVHDGASFTRSGCFDWRHVVHDGASFTRSGCFDWRHVVHDGVAFTRSEPALSLPKRRFDCRPSV